MALGRPADSPAGLCASRLGLPAEETRDGLLMARALELPRPRGMRLADVARAGAGGRGAQQRHRSGDGALGGPDPRAGGGADAPLGPHRLPSSARLGVLSAFANAARRRGSALPPAWAFPVALAGNRRNGGGPARTRLRARP